LLEERERDAALALLDAGFTRLGELAYLRKPLTTRGGAPLALAKLVPRAREGVDAWDDPAGGTSVRSIAEQSDLDASDQHAPFRTLASALSRSYIDTLDCPELCGLRTIDDVLDSHRSVGAFDPTLWWVLFSRSGEACGCLLLSACPDADSVELVYLGVGPELRGRGLGAKLLDFGVTKLWQRMRDGALGTMKGTGGLTCAVDTRNPPALKVYTRAGFQRFAVRMPFVRSVAG
jgi:ribosomal protein S18 acetylase RimI-like enzyme